MEAFKCFSLDNAELELRIGSTLADAVEEAIDIARLGGAGALVSFTFDGIEVTVSGSSESELIAQRVADALRGGTGVRVGPWPSRSA